MTTASRTGLSAGTYEVTVTDKAGTSQKKRFAISAPADAMKVTAEVTNIAKAGNNGAIIKIPNLPNFRLPQIHSNNGAIKLRVSGGKPFRTLYRPGDHYAYLWSNGATTKDISGLGPGIYKVVITDKQGCKVEKAYKVVPLDNRAPLAPVFRTFPQRATLGIPVIFQVAAGIDPDGDRVKVQLTATGSDVTGDKAFDSGLGSGAVVYSVPVTFNKAGTQKVYAITYDAHGKGSGTAPVSRSIRVLAADNKAPKITRIYTRLDDKGNPVLEAEAGKKITISFEGKNLGNKIKYSIPELSIYNSLNKSKDNVYSFVISEGVVPSSMKELKVIIYKDDKSLYHSFELSVTSNEFKIDFISKNDLFAGVPATINIVGERLNQKNLSYSFDQKTIKIEKIKVKNEREVVLSVKPLSEGEVKLSLASATKKVTFDYQIRQTPPPSIKVYDSDRGFVNPVVTVSTHKNSHFLNLGLMNSGIAPVVIKRFIYPGDVSVSEKDGGNVKLPLTIKTNQKVFLNTLLGGVADKDLLQIELEGTGLLDLVRIKKESANLKEHYLLSITDAPVTNLFSDEFYFDGGYLSKPQLGSYLFKDLGSLEVYFIENGVKVYLERLGGKWTVPKSAVLANHEIWVEGVIPFNKQKFKLRYNIGFHADNPDYKISYPISAMSSLLYLMDFMSNHLSLAWNLDDLPITAVAFLSRTDHSIAKDKSFDFDNADKNSSLLKRIEGLYGQGLVLKSALSEDAQLANELILDTYGLQLVLARIDQHLIFQIGFWESQWESLGELIGLFAKLDILPSDGHLAGAKNRALASRFSNSRKNAGYKLVISLIEGFFSKALVAMNIPKGDIGHIKRVLFGFIQNRLENSSKYSNPDKAAFISVLKKETSAFLKAIGLVYMGKVELEGVMGRAVEPDILWLPDDTPRVHQFVGANLLCSRVCTGSKAALQLNYEALSTGQLMGGAIQKINDYRLELNNYRALNGVSDDLKKMEKCMKYIQEYWNYQEEISKLKDLNSAKAIRLKAQVATLTTGIYIIFTALKLAPKILTMGYSTDRNIALAGDIARLTLNPKWIEK